MWRVGHFDTKNGGNRYTNLTPFFAIFAGGGFAGCAKSGVDLCFLSYINLYNIYIYR